MMIDHNLIQERYKSDPEFFFKYCLKLPTFNINGIEKTHWSKQLQIAKSVRDNKYTLVESGHGTGKTHVTASIALWFLFCFPNSLVLSTAPTERQVKEVLWAEISKQYDEKILGGRLTDLKLQINDNWKALGFTARESVDQEKMASRMQGFHSEHILIIFDEAAGVNKAFWIAKEGCLSGSHARFLGIGNPTSSTGDFFDSCRKYNAIRISCIDHPNVKHNKTYIKGAVSKDWVKERKDEWGETSPLYQSRVLGIPPDQSIDSLFRLSDIENALIGDEYEELKTDTRAIGVDVARFGDDQTVITVKIGKNVKEKIIYNKKDLNFTIAEIKRLDNKYKTDYIVIDDTGVGGGVTDGLKGYKRLSDNKEPTIIPVNYAGTPVGFFNSVEFENIKAEIFWLLKIDFEKNNIKMKEEGKIVSELLSIKYEYTGKQKIRIVSKENMRKQGIKSPNEADSLALANYGTKLDVVCLVDMIKTPTISGNIMANTY